MSKTSHAPPQQSIGQNIRLLREEKGMTQRGLAHLLGHEGDDAGAYISRVEADETEPRVSTLVRIAQVLGVELEALLVGGKN